jgi:hypothetical protein
MISDHFFDSEPMKLAKSCGLPPTGSELNLANVSLTSADFRASLMAAVEPSHDHVRRAGRRNRPVQVITRRSGYPLSAIVGTLGSSAMRFAPIVTSALILPSRRVAMRQADQK